jgi:hypothetical protein
VLSQSSICRQRPSKKDQKFFEICHGYDERVCKTVEEIRKIKSALLADRFNSINVKDFGKFFLNALEKKSPELFYNW